MKLDLLNTTTVYPFPVPCWFSHDNCIRLQWQPKTHFSVNMTSQMELQFAEVIGRYSYFTDIQKLVPLYKILSSFLKDEISLTNFIKVFTLPLCREKFNLFITIFKKKYVSFIKFWLVFLLFKKSISSWPNSNLEYNNFAKRNLAGAFWCFYYHQYIDDLTLKPHIEIPPRLITVERRISLKTQTEVSSRLITVETRISTRTRAMPL